MDIMNALGYGGIVAVIGMLIVFLGLIILIVCVWLMGKAFQAAKGNKVEKPAAPAPASAPVAAPAPAAAAPVVEEIVVNDAQLIAVIAAAIAAYDNTGKRLVVRKVRRISGWNAAARREQVYKF